MNDNDAVPMIKLHGVMLPLDMLDADLRRRWDQAQSRYEGAATQADKQTAQQEIDAVGREATAALSPLIALKMLQAAPRRSVLDRGRG